MTDNDPAVYLTKAEPTPSAKVLTQQIGLHAGASVPLWMLAEVASRLHDAARWIAARAVLERKIKRHAWTGLGTVMANIALVATIAAHSLKATGAAEERDIQRDRSFLEYRDNARRETDRIEQDIRDIRRELRRMSGADKLGPNGYDERADADADRLSLLDGSTPLLTAGALSSTSVVTPPRPGPRTCGDFCNSNLQCSSHFGRVCPFCSFGSCSAAQPLEPTDPPPPTGPPPDAGVDAESGGTTPQPDTASHPSPGATP